MDRTRVVSFLIHLHIQNVHRRSNATHLSDNKKD